jgi:peptidoglycan hydrolase CwlO-like protein
VEDINLTTIIVALGGGFITYLGTKYSNRANLEKTNTENADVLYRKYQEMVDKLEKKVDKLEAEITEIKSKYEKEIAYYQKLVEELEDENDELREENMKLKGGI